METIEMIGTDAETEATCDGLERCPFHNTKTADKWCNWCDTPEKVPPMTTCRCQL